MKLEPSIMHAKDTHIVFEFTDRYLHIHDLITAIDL